MRRSTSPPSPPSRRRRPYTDARREGPPQGAAARLRRSARPGVRGVRPPLSRAARHRARRPRFLQPRSKAFGGRAADNSIESAAGGSMSQSSPLPAFQPDLANVLERITDGFFALDAQWNIVYMNAEARRMLHAPPVSEILGKQWLETFPMARGTAFEREYARAMRDQVPVSFVEWSRTSNCWFEVKAYPSPDGISV